MKNAAAAVALSRELAEMLGQNPNVGFTEHHDHWDDGVLEVAYVPSRTEPKVYRLVRTASGWQHANADCRGWLIRQHCAHVDERNKAMESTALVQASGAALALMDDFEDQEIASGIRDDLAQTWIYQFKVGGTQVTGVSAKGVENGCRELAKKGEAIRELDVRLEYEDENEARFLAKAGRYGVNADGREILLDTAIRAKRQPKRIAVTRDGHRVEEFDKDWYEKGVTKAVRNAKLALMPDSIVALIVTEAQKAGRYKLLTGTTAAPRAQVQAPTRPNPPAPPQPGPAQPTGECDHEPKFDERSTLMVCTKCGLVMEEPPAPNAPQQQRALVN